MSGQRKAGIHNGVEVRVASDSCHKGHKQPRFIKMGRNEQDRRLPSRGHCSFAPHRMPQKTLSQGAFHGTQISIDDVSAAWAGNAEAFTAPVLIEGGVGPLEEEIQLFASARTASREIAQKTRRKKTQDRQRRANQDRVHLLPRHPSGTGHRSETCPEKERERRSTTRNPTTLWAAARATAATTAAAATR